MTYGDLIRSLNDEQLAVFLAAESYRFVKPIYEMTGCGITEAFIVFLRLRWLKSEVDLGGDSDATD